MFVQCNVGLPTPKAGIVIEGKFVGLLRHQGGTVAADTDGSVALRLPVSQHSLLRPLTVSHLYQRFRIDIVIHMGII